MPPRAIPTVFGGVEYPSLAAARRARVSISATAPYAGPSNTPANIPPAVYGVDQPTVAPDPPQFRKGYHDVTFQNWAAPVTYGGRTLQIARADIEIHDSGASFLGSSILAIASTRFPAVYTALGVRVAPAIALPRQIDGGARGLARIVRGEVEDQLCPRGGLLPSPCFPSTLWGAISIDLALMGFAVLQHVYGPPDARGIRRIYTRRWPTWAVYYQPYRRTYVAITNEGPVDILNDGKFTLIGKTDIPHLQGAIRALMMPVLDGVQVIQARAQWIDRFSDPKFIATLPPDIAARSDIGIALQAALRIIRGPGGYGVLPNGTDFKAVGLEAKASTCFADALASDNSYIASILTGVDTSADAGVYKPLVFWGILRSTVGDDLAAINRGINQGHVHPYTRFNYAAGIEDDEARGTWVDPVLSTPLPDPEKDARIAEEIKRYKALTDQAQAERAAGGVVDKDRIAFLADRFEVQPFALAGNTPAARLDLAPTDLAKVVRVDEARASRDLPPIGDERGQLTIMELEALGKAPKAEPGGAPPEGSPLPSAPPGARTSSAFRMSARGLGAPPFRVEASQHSVKFDEDKRHAVYIRDGYKCAYCGKHDATGLGKNLSLDHINAVNPNVKGGGDPQNTKHSPATNIITSCGSCNSAKQDRTPRQWNQYQKSSGQAPPPTDWSKLRRQAAKPIDIKAGEKNAKIAHDARMKEKAGKDKGGGKESAPDKGGPGIQHDPENGQFAPG